ncbi:hypothetical protein MBAV_003984 [Candidatus Magnetobacterium bavaricum]|uniref:Uncharacterized protein n=1 Tax=Candidatus Magnetobacterium bavaricum TaxID=29290 RepID=A0A0F3GPD6_9BACT|nr:hypothetical protein MBAV_003984 [Candidatus Magnetobacterium bavaricum]
MADQFGVSTQQDLKSGGDGVKLYGWNVLNSDNASAMDVDITYTGNLRITSSTTTTDAPMTHPFVYQLVTGDFDIDVALTQVNAGAFQGLMCRDPNASAGEDWVAIGWDSSPNLWWGDLTNDVNTSGNLSSGNVYVRLARVGNVFTAYRKANPGDSWTSVKTFTRNDFAGHDPLQVGLYQKRTSATATVRFDYFQGTYSGGTVSIDGALTWPKPTVSASASSASVGSGSLTLPKDTLEASCSQSGSFVDITLFSPMLSADTPADASVNVALPLPVFDTLLTGSNNVAGQMTLLPLQGVGTELAGCTATVALSLGQFSADSATNPHSDIPMRAIRSEALCLTGSVATAQTGMPSLTPEGNITTSHIITSLLRLPRPAIGATLATGNNWTMQGQCPTLQLSTALATGNAASCNTNVPVPGLLSISFSNPLAESTMKTPQLLTEGVGCRDFYATIP